MQPHVSRRGQSSHHEPDKPIQTNPITIRVMSEADLGQVVQLDRLSFSMPWPESAFRYELFENPHSFLLVAENHQPGLQKEVVGAIVVWMILEEAHIATLAVHPELRRKGVAGALLATALKRASQAGARTATLEVRSMNVPAQELYSKFRFDVVGRRQRYYRDSNDDALIMTVDLSQRDGEGVSYSEWVGKIADRVGDV